MQPNSALLTDACASPLRAQRGGKTRTLGTRTRTVTINEHQGNHGNPP
jgi:hypothetical protein